MKKTYILIFAIIFVLQTCICGCTHYDNNIAVLEGESTTENTINSSCITSTETTSQEKICEGPPSFEYFKSVEELLEWIHNDDFKGSMFRQSIQLLQLDRIMVMEAVDDTFTLEYIRTFQRGSGSDAQIEYYFLGKKGERVGYFVQLKYMHKSVDDIAIYVSSDNLENDYLNYFKSTYRDISVMTRDEPIP